MSIHNVITYLSGCVRYPYDALDEERTKDNVASNAALAMESGAPVNGIKGPSALARLSHFHPVWGYSLDYMHCILQGVTRQIAEHLFDSSNSERAYYLGKSHVRMSTPETDVWKPCLFFFRLLCFAESRQLQSLQEHVKKRCFHLTKLPIPCVLLETATYLYMIYMYNH